MATDLASFSRDAEKVLTEAISLLLRSLRSLARRGHAQLCPLCHSCSELQQHLALGLPVWQLPESLGGYRLLKELQSVRDFICVTWPCCAHRSWCTAQKRGEDYEGGDTQELLLSLIVKGVFISGEFGILLMLGAPELDGVVLVRSPESRVEGENHLQTKV